MTGASSDQNIHKYIIWNGFILDTRLFYENKSWKKPSLTNLIYKFKLLYTTQPSNNINKFIEEYLTMKQQIKQLINFMLTHTYIYKNTIDMTYTQLWEYLITEVITFELDPIAFLSEIGPICFHTTILNNKSNVSYWDVFIYIF